MTEPARSALAWTLAALPIIGHLYHFVLVVNVTSGFGLRESTLDRIRLAALAVLCASAAWFGWKTLHAPWWNWHWLPFSYAALCLFNGLVLGPLGSLRIALRRNPPGIASRSVLAHATDQAPRQDFVGTGSNAMLFKIRGNESLSLQSVEWVIPFQGLPHALNGLRILQVSDLHFSHAYRRAYFDWVVERCLEHPADLVLVSGDIVEDDASLAWIEPVLGRLQGRFGKFAILGNHDYMHEPARVEVALSQAGYHVIEGRWAPIEINGVPLAIGGTSAPWGPLFHREEIPPADFRILLSHVPDLFPRATRWGIDFMLAGHNHGGQIRFPLVGPIFMPSRYSRRFDQGFFRSGRTLMYVSRGIGGKHPVRLGCPPEISWFTLQSV